MELTENEILDRVIKELNEWDLKVRNTYMTVPYYIKEIYHLPERQCFRMTERLVNARLIKQIRDYDYILTELGRTAGEQQEPWTWIQNKNAQRSLARLLPTSQPTQYANHSKEWSTKKSGKSFFKGRLSKKIVSISKWFVKFTNHAVISGIILAMVPFLWGWYKGFPLIEKITMFFKNISHYVNQLIH